MNIYQRSVKNPITTALVFVAVIIFGLYSYSRLSIDLYPEMELPTITVMTTYAGANSADIETNVTKMIENQMSSIPNVKKTSSVSQDNMSIVTIEFNWGENLDESTNYVRDRIDRIMDYLPDGCDRPMVFKFNTNQMPIMFYAITANESYSGIQRILEDQVINSLNRVNGLGSVSLAGGPKRAVYVETTPQKLDAYNLTIEQIGNAIRMENLNLPAGNVRMGKEDYQLRIEGEFSESAYIKDIIVGNYNGKEVFLKDVASVNDTIKDVTMETVVNGQRSLTLMVTKQSGANAVAVGEEVQSKIEELKKTLPDDIEFHEIFNSADFIKNSISGLSEALLYALIFVVLIILFFLGRWRATFIIALTIPVSLVVAFIYLQVSGGSLNIISLSSLSIAIGLVVDDAIVVLENINKHIERGSSPRDAAVYGTNEVWLSVVASTLVIIAVFFPLTMVGGMYGIMFKQLGYIVCLTITVSLVAAITLTPMLSSRLLKMRNKDDKENPGWHKRNIVKLLDGLDNFYVRSLNWALNHKKTVIFSGVGIFIFSVVMMATIGMSNMPVADQGYLSATVEIQRGTRVEETVKFAEKVSKDLKDAYGKNLVFVSYAAGASDVGGWESLFNTTGTNIITFDLKFISKTERTDHIEKFADTLRAKLKNYPEVVNSSVTTNSNNMGSGGETVDIEIYGYDFNVTNALAQIIRDSVSSIQGAKEIQISRKDDKAQLQINFNRQKLAQLGLNVATVATFVRNRVAGMIASQLREEGDEYEIIVRYTEDGRNSISDIENITFATPTGKMVKLSEVGTVTEIWLPPNIQHKSKERVVTVSVKYDGKDLNKLAAQIKEKVKTVEKPQDVMIVVGGAYEDFQENMSDMVLLMMISLLLVYVVMASQFESFSKPFIIMLSIIFALSGVLIALTIFGYGMDMIAMLGAIMLIGIVVKNGIVLVDFTNLTRDRGVALNEAIKIAGRSRLRPVLMTTATATLGMLPMAFSTSEGAEIWKSMAIAIIGGLTFSTVVTLVIVPTVYAAMSKRGERKKNQEKEELKYLD